MVIKKEASPEVYLAGLRTYKSESLDRAPREGTESSYIEKLWVFLERLAGMGNSLNNKISKIDIFYNGRETECNCGAIILVDGASEDTEEKLNEPCSCRGAQGIVVFQEARAAVILRGIIKNHKNLHADGQTEQRGYAATRSIKLCETCCFNNRKIKCSTVRPVENPNQDVGDETDEEGTADLEEEVESSQEIITEQQLSAAAIILQGVLGLPLILSTSTLVTGTRGANLSEAFTSIVKGVRDIFQNPQNATALPKKRSQDEYKKAISDAISKVVVNTSSDECIQKAAEWVQLFAASESGEVEVPQEQEIRINVDNNNDGSKADESGLLATESDFTMEVTEQDLTKQYENIDPMLVVCREMDIESMGETTAAETTLNQLRKIKVTSTNIYVKVETEVKNRLKDEHSKNMGLLSEAIRKLQSQINLFKFTKGELSHLSEAEKTKKLVDKGHELPTKIEINQDIKKFESCVNVLEQSLEEINDIINDEDIEENKNEFNTIHTRIKPEVKEAMSTLAELVKGFKKWLRFTDELRLSKELKEKLKAKVKEEAKFYTEIQEINVRVAKIDRKFNHGIKSYEASGLGSLLNQQKVETFYGEENVQGKKWQNLFEWFKKIEMQVCRNINDKPSQLFEVMSYLSPSIRKIAEAHRPEIKTYSGLKAWLIENHLNEARIVRELQNRIASITPSKMKDVEGFIIHTRGILASIEEHCAAHPRLRESLLSEKNVTALIKFVLGQISVVTKRDEFTDYLTHIWIPFRKKTEADGAVTTPEQELKKMDEHLDGILDLAKAQHEHMQRETDNFLSGPQREGAARGRGEGRGYYRSRGGRRGGASNSFSSYGRGRGTSSSKETREEMKNSVDYCLVVIGKKKGSSVENSKVLTTNPNEGANLIRNTKSKSVFVQVTEDDLSRAKAWEKARDKLKLPCWLCTGQKTHELWNCQDHKSTTSVDRFKKARDKETGPGTQCFSCLSGTCFIIRALEAGKNLKGSEASQLKPCINYKKKNLAIEIACTGCVDDASKSPDGLVKKQRPMHALICPKKEHCEGPVKIANSKRIGQKFGSKNSPQLRIQCVMQLTGTQEEMKPGAHVNNIDGSKEGQFKNDNQKRNKTSFRPSLPEISEKEYKGAEVSRLLNTTNGDSMCLDLQKKEILRTLIKASKGLPLYFMQEFNLDGIKVLCFFDSGAMFNLMKTAIARKLNLPMVSRKPMYVVGAGEHVHSTGDGKYELILGQGKHGERYLLEVAGSEELTGYMLEADFSQSHEEVRDLAAKFAEEGQEIMSEDEKLPLSVGGTKAGMIIGLSTPTLQPKIIMSLPSGLLVARSRLKDVHGSQIVFGGMFDNYKRYFQSNYIGHPNLTPGLYKMTSDQVDEYTLRHQFCWEEYCNFRDSIRVDKVHFSQGREHNEKWKETVDKETDAMAEESPVVIAGSEDKRGEQLHRRELTRRLINSGGIVFQKKIHEEIEPIEEYQTYPVREGLMEEEKKARTLEKTMFHSKRRNLKENLENNILMSSVGKVDAYKVKVEELVNEEFNIEAEPIPVQEGVYFQAKVDKINYYKDIEEDPELEELLQRNTSVQYTATEECTIGTKGLAAFQKATNGNWWSEDDAAIVSKNCEEDHGCLCSTGDLDLIFDDIGDGLVNSEKDQWSKMKKAIRKWEDDETIGTGIDYRCTKCANCKDCLNSGRSRARSQREEDEQATIESSVRIDWENKRCYVYLPWIKSPQELALRWGAKSNLRQANHFLRKMLAKGAEDRASLTRFWDELKKRDVVTRLKDLSEDLQKQIMSSAVLHFYPWNCVFKADSITTPCRMVVDSRTSGLNDHLAKGLNTLNNLQQILIKFRGYKYIGSYDISKMYNMLYIEQAHLQYQLILWVDQMNPENEVEVWVMLRAIYGTISSGNQAEVAIRRGAAKLEKDYPQGAYTIIHETYVDDGVPCRDDKDELNLALEEVGIILERIGFSLKCTTVSGQTTKLSEKASSDGVSIGIAGYKYEPEKDLISLAFRECNFNRVVRGSKAPNKHPVVYGEDIDEEIFPEKLTRAQCVGKLAECYDLIGLFMPLTVQGKIMARKIAYLEWAEYIPQELMKEWHEICKKIQDVRHKKIRRCVIPSTAENAKSVDLMEIHDGSKEGAATVVYARSLLEDGTFSTRMLFSRSCLCPVGQVVPRNELTSSHLGATAAYISRLALAGKVDKTYSFGDSYVALLWAENPELKLKSWAFARVQDIKRLNGQARSFWVKGTQNIADIATKGVVTVGELDMDSPWHTGLPWMHLSIEKMIEQEVILDFEGVMKSLSAKDREILKEEQNPSLPDLAAGSRKNKNPEFDIATAGTIEDLEDFYRIVQCYKISDPTEDYSRSDLPQSVGTKEGVRNIDKEGGCETPPQFCAGMWFGVTPEMMIRHFLEIPESMSNDLSLLVEGQKPTRRKVQFEKDIPRRQVTRYGWKVTFRATSVMTYYRMKTQHAAHQTPSPGHHLYGKITPEQRQVRDRLAETCRVCGRVPKLSKQDVNMGYLDSLCSGQRPNVNREDRIVRKGGSQDWKPSWKKTASMEKFQEERSCFVTTRSKSKSLEKSPGKENYEPNPRKRLTKPSQKPKKIQEPAKTNEEYIEEIRIGDQVKIMTWKYFNREMSKHVTEYLTAKEKEKFEFDKNEKVWKHCGRMLERREIEYRDVEVEEFLDSSTISFVQPVAMGTDPIVFQLLLHIHWEVFPHKGVNSTNRLIANILYVVRGGYVVRALRDECQRCRIILKKHIKECMGSIPPEKLIISPAFSFVQIDVGGPFKAYSRHGKRSVLEVNALVIVCITTGAVSIMVLETLEAPSVVKGLIRHSCRYGYPIIGYTDKGTGLKKGLGVQVELINFDRVISKETGMKLILKPTQSHESRGKVERVIQVLKKYIQERQDEMLTQSIMDWETTFSYVSNFINNLPMARMTNSRSLSYDIAEILTPNRLLLGKNNQRSPNYIIEEQGVTHKERLSKNNKILQAFFTLLNRMTPDLVDRPKWHKSSEVFPKVGDYCLFKHKESNMGSENEHWKIGKVIEIRKSESNATSEIYVLEYRTAIKQKKKKAADWKIVVQKTDRAARELVILFTLEEIDSTVGSEEHLARLRKKITEGKKKKSWGTGSKVKRIRIPKHRKF